MRQFIDKNDCTRLTQSFLVESFGFAGAKGVEECNRIAKSDEAGEDLQQGQYEIEDVEIKDEEGTVTIKTDEGTKRVYKLVKGTRGWLINDIPAV